ncbi:hypothetical protein C6341_g7151 [Phytophthora cactorum]|nr:hypothetical protein C6341_g7151 [Phytophthora cactorum]
MVVFAGKTWSAFVLLQRAESGCQRMITGELQWSLLSCRCGAAVAHDNAEEYDEGGLVSNRVVVVITSDPRSPVLLQSRRHGLHGWHECRQIADVQRGRSGADAVHGLTTTRENR